jgi:hypothetical protein
LNEKALLDESELKLSKETLKSYQQTASALEAQMNTCNQEVVALKQKIEEGMCISSTVAALMQLDADDLLSEAENRKRLEHQTHELQTEICTMQQENR